MCTDGAARRKHGAGAAEKATDWHETNKKSRQKRNFLDHDRSLNRCSKITKKKNGRKMATGFSGVREADARKKQVDTRTRVYNDPLSTGLKTKEKKKDPRRYKKKWGGAC